MTARSPLDPVLTVSHREFLMGKPRKPQNRGDVRSWSWLRVRERIATVRVWMYEHPTRTTIGWSCPLAVGAALTLEHWQVTFPWLQQTATAVFS